MEKYGQSQGANFDAVVTRPIQEQRLVFENFYHVECIGPDGELKWEDDIYNLVTNEGLDDVLSVYFGGSLQDSTWFVGLTDGAPLSEAATDTLASHPGWTEFTAYSEGDDQPLVLGAVASQSVSNSGSPASFSIISPGGTVGGAYISSVTSGTAGILYGVGAFTGGDKSTSDGDTLNVTVTLTAASA
jgi:hypothetical protein